MSQPPFGDPGVCPTIALFSLSTNQSPIGGSLSTTSFRLKATEIEAVAYELLQKHCPDVLRKPSLTPVADIIKKLEERTGLKSSIENLGEFEGKKILLSLA